MADTKYPKYYDLNISDNSLTHLTAEHALKEIISNAIDEHNSLKITPKKDVEIGQNKYGKWFIRDYGRGIKPKDLEFGVNQSKKDDHSKIGYMGVGLKDAIGILYSNKFKFQIFTKNHIYTPKMKTKNDFPDEETLHMEVIENNTNKIEKGTEFVFEKLTREMINNAKDKFIKYQKPIMLFETEDCKLFKLESYQSIFINGVEVNANTGYHFSYDVKSTDKIRELINRDRKHMNIKPVMKHIHEVCLKKIIIDNNKGQLFDMLKDILGMDEKMLQEFNQIDILRLIIHQINILGKYVFVGTSEKYKKFEDRITSDGKEIIFLGEGVKKKFGVKNIRQLWHSDKFGFKIKNDKDDEFKVGISTLVDYPTEPSTKPFDFIKFIAPIEKVYKKLPDNIRDNIRNIVIDYDYEDGYSDDESSASDTESFDDNTVDNIAEGSKNNINKLETNGYDFDNLPLKVLPKLTDEKHEEKLFAALFRYIASTIPDSYIENIKKPNRWFFS
jgi:hypothetical protein